MSYEILLVVKMEIPSKLTSKSHPFARVCSSYTTKLQTPMNAIVGVGDTKEENTSQILGWEILFCGSELTLAYQTTSA